MRRQKAFLPPEEHERFVRDGYAVLRGAIPPNVLSGAIDYLTRHADAIKGRVTRRGVPKEVAACLTPAVYGAIGELIGSGRAYERHKRLVHRPRPRQADKVWEDFKPHTDNDYPTLVPDMWSVAAFMCLTKIESRSGALMIYPGSSLRYHALLFDTLGALRVADTVVEERGPGVEFLTEPGDVLLQHHLLGHGATTNSDSDRTAHALLGHFGPKARVAPGDKPFSRMSTLEKSVSARYLHEKHGGPAPLTAAGAAKTLAEGAAIGRDPLFAETLRWGGETICLYAEKDAPGELRLARTRDWSQWVEAPAPVWRGPATNSFAATVRGRELIAIAGSSEAAGAAFLIRATAPSLWGQPTRLDGLVAPCPLADQISAESDKFGDLLVFHASAAKPGAVLARRGKDWASAAAGPEVELGRLPEGTQAADLRVHPVWDATTMALVVDAGGRRPLYALRHDSEVFAGPARELGGKVAARCLRVYARGRRFWLVSYLAPKGGRDRLFWGRVDWEKKTPTLEPLGSPADFDAALGVVGLR